MEWTDIVIFGGLLVIALASVVVTDAISIKRLRKTLHRDGRL